MGEIAVAYRSNADHTETVYICKCLLLRKRTTKKQDNLLDLLHLILKFFNMLAQRKIFLVQLITFEVELFGRGLQLTDAAQDTTVLIRQSTQLIAQRVSLRQRFLQTPSPV